MSSTDTAATPRTGSRTALVTGASRGLGLALTEALAAGGWQVVVDGRHAHTLAAAVAPLGAAVHAVTGDIGEEDHRHALVEQVRALGGAELVVHNAGVLGPSPQPALLDYPLGELRRVFDINVFAPLRLTQLLDPVLDPGATVVAITSDAAVEAYEGWGGYGSAKAALEQAFAVLAAERDDLRVYRIDPGDMRTQMHQDAFPGEDISDRPPAAASVPAILDIVSDRPPSGRYVAERYVAARDRVAGGPVGEAGAPAPAAVTA